MFVPRAAPSFRSLSPRWPGGEGRVRGAAEQNNDAATLTLPSLRNGSLPLPHCGRGALQRRT
jgi:hypothetical protein